MKESIQETFWKQIWQKKTSSYHISKWLQQLESNYWIHVTPKNYDIELQLVNQITGKIQPQKLPGSDLINSFWYKRFPSTHETNRADQHTYRGNLALPLQLILAATSLLPKNRETEIAKNYRPIACLNLMYEIYTKWSLPSSQILKLE